MGKPLTYCERCRTLQAANRVCDCRPFAIEAVFVMPVAQPRRPRPKRNRTPSRSRLTPFA